MTGWPWDEPQAPTRTAADTVDEVEWHENEDGHWCPACGDLVRSAESRRQLPSSCRQCGFPEFEEGNGYFTDED